jgi:phage protein D
MSPNYFAPTFRIDIDGNRLAADVSKHIQRVSVVSRLARQDAMDSSSLTLVNAYPEMRWTHNTQDRSLLAIGNTIAIQMGYVGEEQDLFFGDITSVSANFPASGTPTVDVDGRSRLHRLTRVSRTKPFVDSTDKQIVEKVISDGNYGLTADVGETQVVYPSVTQENQTDLEFLLDRAARINFRLRVEGKTLFFRPAEEDQVVVATFEWGKSLQSFRPTMNAAGQVSQVTVRGYDPMTKQAIVARYPTGGAAASSGPQVAEDAFGPGEEQRVDSPISSEEEAQRRAQAIYEERLRGFLTGTGTVVGIPTLRAGMVVALENLGQFKGNYRLTEVRHDIGVAGYTTTFTGEWITA